MPNLRSTTAMLIASLVLTTSAIAAPPEGKGKPDKGDEPSGPFIPAYIFTESGGQTTIKLANRELTSFRTVIKTGESLIDGITVDPRGGRMVLSERVGGLFEYRYDITQSGEITLTQDRTPWEGGEACLSIAYDGLAIRSSLVVHGYHVRYLDGSEDPVVPTERMDSCGFFDGTHDWVTFISPDNAPQRLERHGLDGSVEVIYAPNTTDWSFRGVDAAPDGQSYVINWWDHRGERSQFKVSVWRPGQDLAAITPVAVDATSGSFACDWNGDGQPDGVIYQSFQGNKPRWILDDGAARDITPSRKGSHHMKATC